MPNCLNVSVAVLSTLAIAFLITSVATNHWRSLEIGSWKRYQGLFKECFDYGSKENICGKLYKDFENLPGK